MIAFIRENKDQRVTGPDGVEGLRWGVEPMCAVLTEHGIPIAAATYYEWAGRQPTRQQLRDEQVTALLRAERQDPRTGKFASTLGSRKMWLRVRSKGHDVARCTVERLMRENGWQGAAYGRKHVTTISDPRQPRHPDLVDRNFSPSAPNRLWVADFTYCPTWTGMVYVAFVIDAYARRIIGWRAARRMTTDLVLDALEHALFTRRREGVADLSGLISHRADAVAELGGARDEGLFLGEAAPLAGDQPPPYLVGKPVEIAADLAQGAGVVGVHPAGDDAEQALLRSKQPIQRREASGRVHAEMRQKPIRQRRDHHMVGYLDLVPAEAHRPAAKPLRQSHRQLLLQFADLVHLVEEDEQSGPPPMIGGAHGVETQHVRAPAKQPRRVPTTSHQRPNDLCIEGSGQLGTRDEGLLLHTGDCADPT